MGDATRRTLILDAVRDSFADITTGVGADDYKYDWSEVTRSTLNDIPKGRKRLLGVYGGNERKADRAFPKRDVILELILEAHVFREKGKEPHRELEMIAGELERHVRVDPTWGGLAINCKPVNIDIQEDGRFDNYFEVSVVCELQYQHHQDDPRRTAYG